MRIQRRLLFWVVAGALGVPLMAAALEDLVVHIECTGPKGKTSYGSGVLISADGHLLTAKHVVADGAECIGGIGSIEAEKMPLEPISQSLKYDGMVLKLDAKTPRHASYCALTRKMQGRDIRVLAFHPGSVRGPSEAEGIVSSSELNGDGMFETTVPSVGGKSGGPAFLYGSTSLIGIVSGGAFNAVSEKIDMLTPADKLAAIAPLKESESCEAVIDGYSVEDHQRILQEREARLRRDLGRASVAEKKLLFAQLDAVARDLSDLQTSYEAREDELRQLRLQLSELDDGQVPSARLQAAQEALYGGDTDLAEEIFKEIEEADATAVKRVAAAAYGLGVIERDKVNWEQAYAHFEKAARLDPTYAHLRWATQMAWRMADYLEGIATGEKMLEAAGREFGFESADYAVALTVHAVNLNGQGLYAQAEPLFREALRIGEMTVGKDHQDYATYLNNLGGLLETTGRYDEAEPLVREALGILEAALGRDHPDYATGLQSLGVLLRTTGRYNEAEPFLRDTLRIDEATIGTAHPEHAVHLNNLAELLRSAGRFAEAEPLYRRASKISEATFGAEHPGHGTMLNDLGNLLQDTGRFDEAEPLLRQVTQIYGNALGEAHPWYATSLTNLANVLVALERYGEAEPLLADALEIREGVLGKDHYLYAMTVWGLAVSHWFQGSFAQADPLFVAVVPALEKSLGPNHPMTQKARAQYEAFLAAKAAASE